ncbi:MAG: hypothetical protein R3F40_06935 [Candidatus Competibacteraceae bacterium]
MRRAIGFDGGLLGFEEIQAEVAAQIEGEEGADQQNECRDQQKLRRFMWAPVPVVRVVVRGKAFWDLVEAGIETLQQRG